MNKTFAAALLVASVLAVPTLVVAQDDSGTSHHFVKDSEITTKVKTKLAAAHLRTLAHLHVDTDANGVVWLRGTVRSQHAADRAVAIARDTEGVTDVHSDIRVVPKT